MNHRPDYSRRVSRVIDHIAEHLDTQLHLETLASVACFSPWHFHRIYRELTGETVADTVRRLRLHRAAGELIRDDTPLERVARRAGYGSLAAFSRAFAGDYGLPPGKYRQRGKLQPPSSPNRQELNDMYQVDIETFEGARLAAIEHRGDYQEIGKAFERAFANAVPQGLVGPATRSIGIYYDDAHSVPRNELRADAGIVVAADADVNGELRVIDIPAMADTNLPAAAGVILQVPVLRLMVFLVRRPPTARPAPAAQPSSYAWGQAAAEPLDGLVRFESTVRRLLLEGDDAALVHYDNLGPDAALSVPTPEHYLPLLYILGMRRPGDAVSFPVEGVDGGPVSMLSVRIG